MCVCEHSLITVSRRNVRVGLSSAGATRSASRHLSAQAIGKNRVLIKIDVRIRAAHSAGTSQSFNYTHLVVLY